MKAEPESSDRRARRLRRLRVEIQDEGIQLVSRTEDDDQLEAAILDEILYARRPPVHEGRRQPYGCFILPAAATSTIGTNRRPVSHGDYEAARAMANGTNTFMLRQVGGPTWLVDFPRGDELSLMRAAMDQASYVVQRHPNGTVRVFDDRRILVYENDEWRAKPYAFTRHIQLAHATGLETNFEVGSRILDFCLHVLSSRHIGATLIWMLRGSSDELGSGLNVPPTSPAVHLSLRSDIDVEPLAALLASMDGACLLENDGTVTGVGASLKYSKPAEQAVQASGGTRHTSAIRFTYDNPNTVAFVVSADGPVTVFSDGVDVLRLKTDHDYEIVPPHLLPADSDLIREINACSNCSKKYIFEATLPGTREASQALVCPVCSVPPRREPRYESVRARVLKPWEDESKAVVEWGRPL